jgi:hypothetical protein
MPEPLSPPVIDKLKAKQCQLCSKKADSEHATPHKIARF